MSDVITGTVAAEVRAEAARQRIPQRKIAEALGMSQAAAWRRLRGDVPFDVAELARIAELFGVPINRLLTAGTGPRAPYPPSEPRQPRPPTPPPPKPPAPSPSKGSTEQDGEAA